MIDYDNFTENQYLGPAPENLTYLLSNCSGCGSRMRAPSGGPPPYSELPPYIRVSATTVCAIILTLGTAGNVLVATVVCKTKELRNSTNLFLINLSLADLLVLLVCVPTVLVELYSMPEVWILGEGMCKAVPYVELTAAHGSILTILAISFERYYAICEPLKAGYTCTQVRALAIIGGVWAAAALLTAPVLLTLEYRRAEYIDGTLVPVCLQMVREPWQRFYYLGVCIALLFALPLLVLLVVYCHIGRHLVLRGARPPSSSSEESQMRARRQVVCMLVAVVLSFFVCLMPFRIFTVWIIITSPEDVASIGMENYYSLLYFCRLLLYANSALNPILYNVISSKFRNSVIRLLRCSAPVLLSRKVTKGTTTSSTATSGGSVKKECLLAQHPSNRTNQHLHSKWSRGSKCSHQSLFGDKVPEPENV
ncbi:QRFP-like peptide receptor [Uloborus diversus]|uniref:QRFP-like peptide receptor n=1 Tax=Uloborus diversus TaxID=327109 RepID=UPI002408FC35|nr:QRFP-like peptide receptor [Uloborus diversus]